MNLSMQDTLHALADPTRREILNLLRQSRLSAGEISHHFSISGAAISRHLSVLKEADLIHTCENHTQEMKEQQHCRKSKHCKGFGAVSVRLIVRSKMCCNRIR